MVILDFKHKICLALKGENKSYTAQNKIIRMNKDLRGIVQPNDDGTQPKISKQVKKKISFNSFPNPQHCLLHI